MSHFSIFLHVQFLQVAVTKFKATLLQKLVDALTEPLKAKAEAKGQVLTFLESMQEFIVSQSPLHGRIFFEVKE